jgi:hypothetical protein
MAEVTVSTAVPSVTFSATGIAVPDEIDILNGRLTDLDTAMGGGMSKSLTTPQGQIAMSDTAIIGDKNDNLAWLVNQINPDFAEGRMQDAIGQIYFIDRIAAIGTTVTATCYRPGWNRYPGKQHCPGLKWLSITRWLMRLSRRLVLLILFSRIRHQDRSHVPLGR